MRIAREAFIRELADAMTDAVDMDTLIAAFWDTQYDHFLSLYEAEVDDVLRQDAIDLRLIKEDEELVILDDGEEYTL